MRPLLIFSALLFFPAQAYSEIKWRSDGIFRKGEVCDKKEFIDIHAHVGCYGDGKSGCFVSESMKRSPKYKHYPKAFEIPRQLMKNNDAAFFKEFSKKIEKSSCVQSAVLFALDGYYEKDTGKLNLDKTEFLVPNRFVAEETKKYPNLLWAASVNPYRKREDWEKELKFAYDNGAVMIKLLPAMMGFQPNDPDIRPFYRRLKQYNLPIIIHLDEEGSFSRSYPEYNGVWKIEAALKEGVTVVVAHMATRGESLVPGEFAGEPGKDLVMMASYEQLKVLARNPKYKENLYVDISALPLTCTRERDLAKVLKDGDLWKGRMLYGSDFPLNHWFLTSYHNRRIRIGETSGISQLSLICHKDGSTIDMDKEQEAASRDQEKMLQQRGWTSWTAWTAKTERWDRHILLQYAFGVEEENFHAPKKFLKKMGRITEVNGLVQDYRQ